MRKIILYREKPRVPSELSFWLESRLGYKTDRYKRYFDWEQRKSHLEQYTKWLHSKAGIIYVRAWGSKHLWQKRVNPEEYAFWDTPELKK